MSPQATRMRLWCLAFSLPVRAMCLAVLGSHVQCEEQVVSRLGKAAQTLVRPVCAAFVGALHVAQDEAAQRL